MSVVAMPAATEHPFTVTDLEGMPDDGRRYELIDGMLLVSPAPAWTHQEVLFALAIMLRQACPRHLRVIVAPFAVRQDEFNEVQPDVLVARYQDIEMDRLPKVPVLAVEVLSPSSRLRDAFLRKGFYARLGTASYWLVDPDPDKPSLTVFELADRAYREVACVTGEEAWTAAKPFAVTVTPAALVAGLKP